MLKKLKSWYYKISLAGIFIGGLCLLAMLAYSFADVSGRFLLSSPLRGTVELIEQLAMPSIVFLGLAYCQIMKRHMRVDFLSTYISENSKTVADLVAYGAGMVTTVVVGWLAFQGALASWSIREVTLGSIEFPIYLAKFMAAFGLWLLAGQLLLDFLDSIKRIKGQAD